MTQNHMRHADPAITLKKYQKAIPVEVRAAALAVEAELNAAIKNWLKRGPKSAFIDTPKCLLGGCWGDRTKIQPNRSDQLAVPFALECITYSGTPERIRTSDLLLRRQTLYPG